MRYRQEVPIPLQLRLQARPEFASVLREEVRKWLRDAGASKREAFELLLAVTEAFANAVEHPEEPRSHLVDVEGTITDQAVTVSIRDYGKWQDEESHKKEGGMGLALMEKLMDGVRVECFLDGTTVTMQRRLAMH
jgi:anti-sigma regulatory factor (Ser/Thr protein kinase)